MRAEAKNRWRFEPNDLSTREALIIAFALLLIFGLFVAFGPDVNVKFGGPRQSQIFTKPSILDPDCIALSVAFVSMDHHSYPS
jgi:hypothetical protein